MTAINVVNQSTQVTDHDVQTMVRACATQVRRHLAPACGLLPPPVTFLGAVADAQGAQAVSQPGSWVIVILDDADQAGALGYHSEDDQGRVYGRVFTKPSFSNGSDAFTGKYPISSILSHEICETVVDPFVNKWAEQFMSDGSSRFVAVEDCDPVEDCSYTIIDRFTGKNVPVSDFVLPAWFDNGAQPKNGAGVETKFSWMGSVGAPFTLTPGGYMVVNVNGQEQQVFGEAMPDWRKEAKLNELARSGRRLGYVEIENEE